MKVLLDTSAFIALFVKEEPSHSKVSEKYLSYKQQRALLLTSDYILDELYTRLMYDFGKNITKQKIETLTDSIEKGELKILSIDEAIFKKATAVFTKYAEHKISFTDATTYVLYKDFAIDEIFTLDRDFKRMRAKTSF